ncbi:MAG: hypothetical protein JNG89_16410 [Planctomycetaceae bacterium]|nr:hypothetical protein [Planctomycetaceae bacterium]
MRLALFLELWTVLSVFSACSACAAEIDLAKVAVVHDDQEFQSPAQVLIEEVARRTGIKLPTGAGGATGQIEFRAAAAGENLGTDGFQMATTDGAAPQITIAAQGRRGALFAVGYLLRHLDWSQGKLALAAPINTTQVPEYAIRGHQLGYRAQANTYDGWDVATFDQYIREMMFFGANAVEGIPFQDDRPTPVMPVGRREMNKAISEICEKYDLEHWVWIPAEFALTDAAQRAAHLKQHEQFSQDCARLNGLFFPGGDPGNNHPQDVLPFLAELAAVVTPHRPEAKMWMSLQGFDADEVEYVFEWLDEHKPDWLGGLVGGPSSPPLELLRARLDKKYQLRDYPDITHIVRCQYPELNLDPAISLTAGRESINPRPEFYTEVFRATAPQTDGFISYSDGCQDDVNKAIWSALGWTSAAHPRATLVEYARCFFSAEDADQIADGILALEQNWQGPLRPHAAVEYVLEQWQQLEAAHPELANDWRWQMLVTRVYYDAYQREREVRETALEQAANQELGRQKGRTPSEAIAAANAVLQKSVTEPTRPDLRNRLLQLFDQMWESCRFQSDMTKFHAISAERGCMLEFLDYPLNNRYWLEDEFEKVLALPNPDAQWARLDELRNWENPGPGGFYDDIGHVGRSPHAVRRTDPLRGAGSYWWFNEGKSRLRLSWLITGSPAALVYEDLDPNAQYTLRFSGFGELKPIINGQPVTATHYETEAPALKEFPVPEGSIQNGKLKVTFESVYLRGVNWRYQPRLAEAWLIRGP